jgi:hypothetical protein
MYSNKYQRCELAEICKSFVLLMISLVRIIAVTHHWYHFHNHPLCSNQISVYIYLKGNESMILQIAIWISAIPLDDVKNVAGFCY